MIPDEIFRNPYRCLKIPEMKMGYKKSVYDSIEYPYRIFWISAKFSLIKSGTKIAGGVGWGGAHPPEIFIGVGKFCVLSVIFSGCR